MQWEFSTYIKERLRILWINTVNSYQIETAYFINNWGNIISTTSFTLTTIFFVNAIYGNVHSIAGYSKDEVLLLTLMGSLNFYIISTFSMTNAETMITDVNRGNLDLTLSKPLPALFYVTFKNINVLSMFRDAAVPVLCTCSVITWSTLNITSISLLSGAVTFFFGLLAADAVMFLLAMLVFWKGEAGEMTTLFYTLIDERFPWEGLPQPIKILFSVIIPVFLTIPVTTSIILSKSSPLPLMLLSIAVSILFQYLKRYGWQRALRAYTSASS